MKYFLSNSENETTLVFETDSIQKAKTKASQYFRELSRNTLLRISNSKGKILWEKKLYDRYWTPGKRGKREYRLSNNIPLKPQIQRLERLILKKKDLLKELEKVESEIAKTKKLVG